MHIDDVAITTSEESHNLPEIRELRTEARAAAEKSSDDRAEILERLAEHDADNEQIALVLRQEPAFAKVFGEAMARLADGRIKPETIRALASYAAFQLETSAREELSSNGGLKTEE